MNLMEQVEAVSRSTHSSITVTKEVITKYIDLILERTVSQPHTPVNVLGICALIPKNVPNSKGYQPTKSFPKVVRYETFASQCALIAQRTKTPYVHVKYILDSWVSLLKTFVSSGNSMNIRGIGNMRLSKNGTGNISFLTSSTLRDSWALRSRFYYRSTTNVFAEV